MWGPDLLWPLACGGGDEVRSEMAPKDGLRDRLPEVGLSAPAFSGGGEAGAGLSAFSGDTCMSMACAYMQAADTASPAVR